MLFPAAPFYPYANLYDDFANVLTQVDTLLMQCIRLVKRQFRSGQPFAVSHNSWTWEIDPHSGAGPGAGSRMLAPVLTGNDLILVQGLVISENCSFFS